MDDPVHGCKLWHQASARNSAGKHMTRRRCFFFTHYNCFETIFNVAARIYSCVFWIGKPKLNTDHCLSPTRRLPVNSPPKRHAGHMTKQNGKRVGLGRGSWAGALSRSTATQLPVSCVRQLTVPGARVIRTWQEWQLLTTRRIHCVGVKFGRNILQSSNRNM